VLTRDINGDTPLHIAAGWGHKEVVKILLTNGGDINLKNHRKQTPLECVKSGKKEVRCKWAVKPEKYGIGYDDIISLLQNSI
jgi:Ankyrin repeat